MKKYLSSLLALILLLNSASALAMLKTKEDVNEKTTQIMGATTDSMDSAVETIADNSELNNQTCNQTCNQTWVPNELVWEILSFSPDTQALHNVRNSNKRFREIANNFLSFAKLEDFEENIFKQLFGSLIKDKKIQKLITQLESEIRQNRNLFLYESGNKLILKDLTDENIKDELLQIFKEHKPTIIKIFDAVLKALKKISRPQEALFNKTLLKLIGVLNSKLSIKHLRIEFAIFILVIFVLISLTLFWLPGKISLCLIIALIPLFVHDSLVFSVENINPVAYQEHTHYNHPISKRVRGYLNIPNSLKKILFGYEKKLKKAIYGEQALQNKKNN